jgi:hypothetical protein
MDLEQTLKGSIASLLDALAAAGANRPSNGASAEAESAAAEAAIAASRDSVNDAVRRLALAYGIEVAPDEC